jgi:hypothetical protein
VNEFWRKKNNKMKKDLDEIKILRENEFDHCLEVRRNLWRNYSRNQFHQSEHYFLHFPQGIN